MGCNMLSSRKVEALSKQISTLITSAWVLSDGRWVHLVTPAHNHYIYDRKTGSLVPSEEHWTSCHTRFPNDMVMARLRRKRS